MTEKRFPGGQSRKMSEIFWNSRTQSDKIRRASVLLYWTKGVNHMIEIVYKEEKQEARGNEGYFHLPKNIRQIGDCKGKQKIYVEDYVYTYLKKLSADSGSGRTAILLGQYNWAEGTAYFFIRGALAVTGKEEDTEPLKFDEHVWKEVSDTMAEYFQGQNILGWFLSLPGELEQEDERILKTHLNHFGGNDKVLFRMAPNENEEAFYVYDSSLLKKLGGFYIYYEKNEAMQNYMIDHGQHTKVEENGQEKDQAVTDFRKIVGQKQEQQQKKQSGGKGVVWGVAVCAAAAVLAVGLSRMTGAPGSSGGQNIQNTSQTLAANGEAQGEKTQQTETDENPEETENGGSTQNGQEIVPDTESTGAEEATAASPSPTEAQPSQEPSVTPAAEQNPAENTGNSAAETSSAVLMEYTVQKGDSLSRISEKYYGTMSRVKDICSLNGITSEDVIYAGQKILLPK